MHSSLTHVNKVIKSPLLESNVVCNFWKYMWVKKCVKIRIILFKHWKLLFKIYYQTAPSFILHQLWPAFFQIKWTFFCWFLRYHGLNGRLMVQQKSGWGKQMLFAVWRYLMVQDAGSSTSIYIKHFLLCFVKTCNVVY